MGHHLPARRISGGEDPDVVGATGASDPAAAVSPRRQLPGFGHQDDSRAGNDRFAVPDAGEDVGDVGPEPPQLMVKVLGRPYVPDRPGLKRRELGLVVFLASRGQPTVATTVQHAVWVGNAVEAKTLWNVATNTRAALGRLDDGSPAMPASRRAHNTLELAPGVRTDLQLLHDIYDHAQDAPSSRAIDLLAGGLDLIEGQPFDGPDDEWAHHTELLVADATKHVESVTDQLVDLASVAGRFDLALHGIRQGLRALPGRDNASGSGGSSSEPAPHCIWVTGPGITGGGDRPGITPWAPGTPTRSTSMVYEHCNERRTGRAHTINSKFPVTPREVVALAGQPSPATETPAATPAPPAPAVIAASVHVRLEGNLPDPEAATSPATGEPAVVTVTRERRAPQQQPRPTSRHRGRSGQLRHHRSASRGFRRHPRS